MNEIRGFFGDNRWLSNFWPVDIVFEGQKYPSVEHAYQASKTTDTGKRSEIRNASSPSNAKWLGKRVSIRDGWDILKLGYMQLFIRRKFENDELRLWLLDTGDAYLEETNDWGDTFWGVCDGVGDNYLGSIIMVERERIKILNES